MKTPRLIPAWDAYGWGIGLILTGCMLCGCQPEAVPTETSTPPLDQVARLASRVSIRIDPGIVSPDFPATTESDGGEHAVGQLRGPDGVTEAFVLDEIVMKAETRAELDAFLARYGGVVLKDGTVPSVPPELRLVELPRAPWYLVRVDLSRTSLDDLALDFDAAGIEGTVAFSSEEAARLWSIVAREAKDGVGPNYVMTMDSSFEHPTAVDASGNPLSFLDFEKFFWMTEDDNTSTPQIDGLSIGVTHAWEYLTYHNVPPVPPPGGSVTFSPTRVAVIDSGFALDTITGKPLLNNVDYFNSFNAPLQWDEVNDDFRAGGASKLENSGGTVVPWHGQSSFGVCCAAERNQFGGAGTGGPVAQPILIRTSATLYNLADAIYTAGNMGAKVITISISYKVGIGDNILDLINDNQIGDAVIACTNAGAVVLASAGNNGTSLDEETRVPCELLDVVCVGSIRRQPDPTTGKITTRHNFGANVAISGPEGVLATVTPDSVAVDADNVGQDELDTFSGTSCATPFVAGVVALMKAADPSLSRDQVVNILQNTANRDQIDEAKLPKGYVDAYRAVRSVIVNLPPTIQLTQPVNGQTIGWRNHPFFRTVYNDPEVDSTDVNAIDRFHGEVIVSSSIDGELCRDASLPYECTSALPELTLGQHIITVTANDPFEGTATRSITVNVVNRPPQPEILGPAATDDLFSHIPVRFLAFVLDQDETIPDDQITWSSNLDGVLGTGLELFRKLSVGTHTITLTAVDGKGVSATDQLILNVAAGEGLPTPKITAPIDGDLIAPGTVITLVGEASDPEDGVLSGARLEWFSNRDGFLGTGNSLQVNLSFPPGNICETGGTSHTITLRATDSNGHVVTVKILIRIGIIC